MPTLGGIARSLHLYEPIYKARQALPSNRRHRAEQRRFYAQFVTRGDLVFDIGANLGNRIETFLACEARVVAVEPQAACLASLRHLYGDNPSVTIVAAGAGAERGEAVLRTAQAHTIASMSDEFIDSTRESGRFAQYHWQSAETVPVTTLDHLIGVHGVPAFCKIDVEGYEPQVLAGLSQPLPALSFEFTAELSNHSTGCIDRLASLGKYEFNVSQGESFAWDLDGWVNGPTMMKWLRSTVPGGQGDVYARLS